MLHEAFSRSSRTWKSSPCRKKLFKKLDLVKQRIGHTLTTAICLGSGSFSSMNVTNNSRAMIQFVAFEDSAKGLQGFAQDPTFTVVDKWFLRDIGIKVLECETDVVGLGPAVGHVGPESLVFDAFLPNIPRLVRELFGARPGVLVNNEVEAVKNLNAKAQAYLANRQVVGFPGFHEDDTVFSELKVFWEDGPED
ncbi:hypothetical protein K470DRAFT_220158 [Piedraia hortae CBS 480.64]|uniref:SRR1-like domain-containing protein n=1 Tax=Piedraia hortae CBS 480.64 TaxID=1314780 RepID=A0A6A7BUL9_9PEZI|nr:hypothetical protein K470DRAFT_220158 [Piedraia hortae CBS 480.64]